MIYRFAKLYKAANLGLDLLVLNMSMIIAYLINDNSHDLWYSNKRYLLIVIFTNGLWLLSANYSGLYGQKLFKESTELLRAVLKTYIVWVFLLFVIIIEILRPVSFRVSLEFLMYTAAAFLFLLIGNKLLYVIIRRNIGISNILGFKAVIAGAGSAGQDLYNYMIREKYCGYQPIGFFDDIPGNVPPYAPYLGSLEECIPYASAHGIADVFCALPSRYSGKIKKLMDEADDHFVRFKLIPDYQNFQHRAVNLQSLGHIPLLSIRPEPLENLTAQFLKNLFDIVIALIAIVFVFSWLFPIMAILIKLESPGPVFFVQLRSGRNNKPFKCFKFRSMRVNNEANSKMAVKGDSRITPIGAMMRKTSIDELPQFLNVLMGDMSVVGPRPHMLKMTDEYAALIEKYMVRHFLKPGITGWAQVTGHRGEIKNLEDMDYRIQADIWYMENWSVLLDLKILFLTFWKVIAGDKAAY